MDAVPLIKPLSCSFIIPQYLGDTNVTNTKTRRAEITGGSEEKVFSCRGGSADTPLLGIISLHRFLANVLGECDVTRGGKTEGNTL